MTGAQLISLVIALAVTPLSTLTIVVLGKNSEHKYVAAEIGRTEAKLETRFQVLEAKMEARFEALTNRLDRMEHELLTRIADLDSRLSRLEARS